MSTPPLTDDQYQEAVDAVEKVGTVTGAATSLGINRSTFSHRVQQARERGFVPRTPEAAKKQKAVDKSRVRELEKIVEQQQARIESLQTDKFKLPASKGIKKSKGSYCRVVIPDTHGCYVDEAAIAAFLFDLEQLAPSVDEIVLLGDHVDCGGFLSQHFTLGYVAETAYTFEDDVSATNILLDRLQETCPKAAFHYLEGNHERRIEKWCVTQAMRHTKDAAYLKKTFGVSSVLNLDKRKIKLYEQGKFYGDCPIPATVKLGKCYFTHGNRTGANPAKAMLQDFGGNVVFGHVHRMDAYAARNVDSGAIGAWTPGCLCVLQKLWNHTQITGWQHGYGLQFVSPDGQFLHVNVPIINGKSYLVPLTTRIAG